MALADPHLSGSFSTYYKANQRKSQAAKETPFGGSFFYLFNSFASHHNHGILRHPLPLEYDRDHWFQPLPQGALC